MNNASQAIAEEMRKVYGDRAKTVPVEMLHGDEVAAFIRIVDEAYRKTADSTLTFD